MLFAISLLLVASAPAFGRCSCSPRKGSNCCSKVSGSCRSACEKLHHDTIADLETKQQRLLDVRNFCPQYLSPFWKCMNQTEDGFGSEDHRSWSVCCEEAVTEKCRRGCRSSFRQSELQHYCRKSDEIEFFSCVEKQEAGEECCGLARSPDCHDKCRRWVQEPGKVTWGVLSSTCTMPVQQCLNNMSKPFFLASPLKYLHCCEEATTTDCKETCRRNLKKRVYDIEIMSNLKEACGPLVLHEGEAKLVQCLLQTEPSAIKRPDPLGYDGALVHCCNKAVETNCLKSCLRVFFNNTTNYGEYEKYCQNTNEENILQCTDEVTEPCELGCDGLTFCHEFNSRPTDLFRSCSRTADRAAQQDLASLPKGIIKLPNKEKLYIKNLSHCSPEKFKALACINQIKPCQRLTQTIRVCYEDCMELMSECVNFSKSKAFESASTICRIMAPPDSKNNCIKLDSFVEQSPPEVTDLTSPCKAPTPCGFDEVCRINRSWNTSTDDCKMFSCSKGCMIGKTQNFLVPDKTYARLIKPGKGLCYNICQCTRQGLKHCREMCKPKGSNCKGVVNGSAFYNGCNLCSCNHGETVCSKKLCDITAQNDTSTLASTTLPCNCQPHYLPVCGSNGQTYPNECLAKCSEIENYANGACSENDPCKNVRCQRKDDVCLPKRQVCLAELHQNCSQHICEKYHARTECHNYVDDPVCDTEGNTHASPCKLLKARKELAYFGPCLANCRNEGEVCGVDGNTYRSECAAHARFIQVDYQGNCSYLGIVHIKPQVECLEVECPPLAASRCMAYTPPGACCPVCAGAFSALFSRKEVDRVLLAFNGLHGVDQLTVEAVMSTLEREIKTAQCSVRGQLTIEQDLLILIVPTHGNEASDQVREACVREAEKLTVLIQRLSPRIMVPLSTSVLTAAHWVHQPIEDEEPGSATHLSALPALLLLAVITNVLAAYLRV